MNQEALLIVLKQLQADALKAKADLTQEHYDLTSAAGYYARLAESFLKLAESTSACMTAQGARAEVIREVIESTSEGNFPWPPNSTVPSA